VLVWLGLYGCGKSEPGDKSDGATAGSNSEAGHDSRAGAPASSGSAPVNTGGQTASAGGTAESGGAPGGATSLLAGNAGALAGSAGALGGSAGALAGSGGSTGGGPSATEGGASSGGGSSCNQRYVACGCGCCVAQSTRICVYPGVGPSFDELIRADKAIHDDSAACAAAGCSLPQEYVCCEAPPPSAEQATYETSVYIGGYDHLRLLKAGAVNCSTLGLMAPKRDDTKFPLELPSAWGIEQLTRLPCSSSAVGPRAIGAIGKVKLRVSGGACVLDANVTAFFADADGKVDAERFDAQAVPVNLALAQCQ